MFGGDIALRHFRLDRQVGQVFGGRLAVVLGMVGVVHKQKVCGVQRQLKVLSCGPVAGARCASSLAWVRNTAWSKPRCLQAFSALS